MTVKGALGAAGGKGPKIQTAMMGGDHAQQDNRMLRMRQAETATSPEQMRQMVGSVTGKFGGGSRAAAKVSISRG